MSFLAPLWLALAGAAAVPLLIHLLRRRIGLRVEFPAARYLVRAEQENSRKLRLRNLLIMFLRVLTVLLIAAAAARPVGRVAGVGHAPTALVLVVDNSLSTSAVVDGRPVLDRLKRVGAAVARGSGPADRLWLVTADGRVTGGTGATVTRAIEELRPLAGSGDLRAAVSRGAALVRSAGLAERQLAVLTDGQGTSWRQPVAVDDVRLSLFVPALRPPANGAVVAASPTPTRWTPGGAVEARVIAARDTAAYRVTLTRPDGTSRTLARGTATDAPRAGGAPVVVRAAPAERGWVAGTVEVEPDELRGDDVRHFAVWIGEAPRVAADTSAGQFAASAVDALVQGGRAQAGNAVRITAADALLALPSLVTAPADPVRVGAANRALERAGVPWRFGAVRRGEATVRFDGEPGQPGAARAADVTATLRYALVPRPDAVADTLARVGGEPWIVGGPGYLLVGSPLDPQSTSLPVRATFLPWLLDAVSQLAAAGSGQVVEAPPGTRVARPAGVDVLAAPDGARLPVAGDDIEVPGRPGVYFFMRGAQRRGALVVNAEGEESLLERLSNAQLRSRFEARQVEVSNAEEGWAESLYTSSQRRPLAAPLLVAALAALVAEALAARGSARRRAGSAGDSRPPAGAPRPARSVG
jgi:hypothetical protein